MPRKPRIEYPGALYHVMSRGDRQEPIFLCQADRNRFLQALGQACERTGWLIHGYVLMDNHYHLLLETPEGGLVAGMHWLQTTYTVRFNLIHNLKGHIFQGRYKAIIIDPAEPEYFRIVGDYIHLNPVRAALLPSDKTALEMFPWSSYPAIIGKAPCPDWLVPDRILSSHQTSARGYAKYMQERARACHQRSEDDAEWDAIRRGWYLGSDEFHQDLLQHLHKQIALHKRESYSGGGIRAHDEMAAEQLLDRGLQKLHADLTEVRGWKSADPRKQALIWLIRSSTTTTSDWICSRLNTGHRSNISRATRQIRDSDQDNYKNLRALMLQCKD